MYLKSIELSGFKSFAKKSVFEFDSSISAIVGPNGSGKSNVAEAFRFVLGEQSIKSLRGKRGEDLIWNGSSSEPRSGRAAVRVIFDNSRKLFDLDFPEVSIERVVHRDGVNEYLINGSQVRLRDIVELLAKANIGSSGHHIISQGEADKILSSSPQDRKTMVEEALGLKIYQYKRLESTRKLEKTAENINQVEALRKEIAPHLKFLGKQMEKFEKAEEMRRELLALAREYLKREDLYLSFSKTIISDEKKPLMDGLKKLSKQSDDAKKLLELDSGLGAIQKHKDDLTREIGKLEGLIMAEQRFIDTEEKLSASNELKTVRLKEVEDLYQEIYILTEIEPIKQKLESFIKERKHNPDTKLVSEAGKRIKELRELQSSLEKELTTVSEKERDVSEAEKAVLRIMSEENELVSKLNLLKAREETLRLEEEEFKRDLEEVGRLVGVEALRFKEVNLEGEKDAALEDRKMQAERKHSLERLKIRLEDSNVSGVAEVEKEYKDTSERDAFLKRELEDLEKSAATLEELIRELEDRLSVEFSTGLESINKEFGHLFAAMFGGGEASLVLTEQKKRSRVALDSSEEILNPEEEASIEEEGLDIKVNLPRKKIRSLMMLSGGERALTSIALIFAISQVKPPPFIILDETDAALDEANSKKYGDLVETLSKRSQLILITHNRETMSRAGVIYGVTMGSNGVSKLLSIGFEEAVSVAK